MWTFFRQGCQAIFSNWYLELYNTLLWKSFRWRFQNELSYAPSITGSQHMHFMFKKQVISQKVFLMKFQKVGKKYLISVSPKLVFKYIVNGTLVENGLKIWVSPCLKVNYGVWGFGLLFMFPSLDYPVSPNCHIVPSTLEQIKHHPQMALSLDYDFVWSDPQS